MPQQTLTDDDGRVLTVISSAWVKTVSILVGLIVFLMLIMLFMAVTNRMALDTLVEQNEIFRQRNMAMDEMLLKRATIQEWTYKQTCEFAKTKGQTCLDNPQWWADPIRYPALINNPSGTGLFPRQQ